jgi:hypothetical protein
MDQGVDERSGGWKGENIIEGDEGVHRLHHVVNELSDVTLLVYVFVDGDRLTT